jgi:hypothetical protein
MNAIKNFFESLLPYGAQFGPEIKSTTRPVAPADPTVAKILSVLWIDPSGPLDADEAPSTFTHDVIFDSIDQLDRELNDMEYISAAAGSLMVESKDPSQTTDRSIGRFLCKGLATTSRMAICAAFLDRTLSIDLEPTPSIPVLSISFAGGHDVWRVARTWARFNASGDVDDAAIMAQHAVDSGLVESRDPDTGRRDYCLRPFVGTQVNLRCRLYSLDQKGRISTDTKTWKTVPKNLADHSFSFGIPMSKLTQAIEKAAAENETKERTGPDFLGTVGAVVAALSYHTTWWDCVLEKIEDPSRSIALKIGGFAAYLVGAPGKSDQKTRHKNAVMACDLEGLGIPLGFVEPEPEGEFSPGDWIGTNSRKLGTFLFRLAVFTVFQKEGKLDRNLLLAQLKAPVLDLGLSLSLVPSTASSASPCGTYSIKSWDETVPATTTGSKAELFKVSEVGRTARGITKYNLVVGGPAGRLGPSSGAFGPGPAGRLGPSGGAFGPGPAGSTSPGPGETQLLLDSDRSNISAVLAHFGDDVSIKASDFDTTSSPKMFESRAVLSAARVIASLVTYDND